MKSEEAAGGGGSSHVFPQRLSYVLQVQIQEVKICPAASERDTASAQG